MALDTPAKIAILGAGPIGLEAALYARFLGYDVELFDQGEVCANVARQAHVRLFPPFGQLRSTLGLAAIEAQDIDYAPPADTAEITARRWLDDYLLPLSRTDLVEDHLSTQTTVVAIGRQWLLKGDAADDEARGDDEFRILLRDAAGTERITTADAVLDATGTRNQPNWLGQGGLPARGERALRDAIAYHLPDVLGSDRERYAGRTVLVVGAGMSAATAIVSLAELRRAEPQTRIVWVTRREDVPPHGPVRVIKDDPLPRRASLAVAANQLAEQPELVEHLPETMIDAVARRDDHRFEVTLRGRHEEVREVDRIVALVGYRPDLELFRELHVASNLSECPSELQTPEPNFYVLGAKSRGRDASFQFTDGLQQIRDLFAILGERSDLDLYRNMQRSRLGSD